jgi:hypothetical protein
LFFVLGPRQSASNHSRSEWISSRSPEVQASLSVIILYRKSSWCSQELDQWNPSPDSLSPWPLIFCCIYLVLLHLLKFNLRRILLSLLDYGWYN